MRKGLIIAGILVVALLGALFLASYSPKIIIDQENRPPVIAQPEPTHTLLFTGDIMLGRLVKIKSDKAGGSLHPFLLIASTTQAADLTISNLEGPVADRGVNQGSIYSFRFDPTGTINALNYAGIDIVNLANNHIWDYGRIAANDTLMHLGQAGIDYIGFGYNHEAANSPLFKTVGSSTVAFLGYTPFYSKALWAGAQSGLSEYDPVKIATLIGQIKAVRAADIIVISIHWGEEYKTHSEPWQQELAHMLIDAGADIIIGHHPHVAQEVERYKEGWIAYSLGNFIFDQPFSEETMQGLMVEATIRDKKVVDFKELPIKLSPTFQPYLNTETSL